MIIKQTLSETVHTISYLLTTLVLMSLAACQSDVEHLDPIPYQVLDSIVSTTDMDFDNALEALKDDDMFASEDLLSQYKSTIEFMALRARQYNAHVITYHTTDPFGQPVIASGVVYYPKSGKPKGVLESITFNKNKYECPSKQIANLQLLIGMAGYIILVPDLIGCGSTEQMPLPYFYNDNASKVSADFRLAATELVRNVYGRSMPSWTLIYGISLSASTAWSLARYYHLHPEMGVHIDQVWLGSGLYDTRAGWNYIMEKKDIEYAFIPNILYSLNYYDQLGINLQEAFRGELSEHYEEWCTGDIGIIDLTKRLGNDITQYLNMDFFQEENEAYQRILRAIDDLQTPNDWKPDCSVHIYHTRDDAFVPFSSSEELTLHLQSLGVNVDFVTAGDGHIGSCATMSADLATLLYR